VTDFLRLIGFQLDLLFEVIGRLPHLWRRRALVSDQLYQSGVRVVHVVLFVGFFMGMIVSLQTGIELARIGQQSQIGTIVAISMAREMGPFIAAVVLSAAVGSALAAELGTMAVSEELLALEVLSIDRTSFLVMPRVVALAVLGPVLTILVDAIGIVGGGLVARSQLGVDSRLYYDTAIEALVEPAVWLPVPKDVYVGLFKAFVFGTVIAVIACTQGLRARGGAIGVGRATQRAVRDSIIAVIVANYLLAWLFYEAF
jgi:phospholipid/cholesterol/gamma-HCH transport system permease protein